MSISYIDNMPGMTDEAFEAFLDFVSDHDGAFDQMLEDIDRISAVLSPERFAQLCDSFELCKTHYCDIQICRDDNDDCVEN